MEGNVKVPSYPVDQIYLTLTKFTPLQFFLLTLPSSLHLPSPPGFAFNNLHLHPSIHLQGLSLPSPTGGSYL